MRPYLEQPANAETPQLASFPEHLNSTPRNTPLRVLSQSSCRRWSTGRSCRAVRMVRRWPPPSMRQAFLHEICIAFEVLKTIFECCRWQEVFIKKQFGSEVTCDLNFIGSGRPRAAAVPEGPGAGPGPRPAARRPGRGVFRPCFVTWSGRGYASGDDGAACILPVSRHQDHCRHTARLQVLRDWEWPIPDVLLIQIA